ncbi:hypothetical protein HUG17_10228 [Dermatophagoides farinae]|nr:hypothetical protein HUG17_10228 [Dermatophagoides farinae]
MDKFVNDFVFFAKDLRNKVLSAIPATMASRSPHNIIDPTSFTSVVRNPSLPVCFSIPNGSLELGTLISIYATITSGGRRFRIDFFQGKCPHIYGDGVRCESNDNENNIAFHFNPRIGGGTDGRDVVVLNSFCDGQWGLEERHQDAFPFQSDTPFRMMILVESDGFKVAVDGRHSYEFKHRCDFRDIARIHIEGNLILDLVEFRKEIRYLVRTQSTSSSLTVDSTSSTEEAATPTAQTAAAATGGDISPPSGHSKLVTSPAIPYMEFDPNLSRPCDIYIAGMLPAHIRDNFVINLANSVEAEQSTAGIVNIPVHISIRADIQAIVRNTMTNGVWGEEELYLIGPFQLIPGTHFDLMISNREDKVVVAINGQPSFEYKHRHESKTIDSLQINGGVVLTSIRYENK